MNLTQVEQDYLKAVYESEHKFPDKIVSLKNLSHRLHVSGATVTEAVKRLEKKDLLTYQSYKGVSLTESGRNEAVFIQKSHRVWEYFLLNMLGYQEDEIHVEAEKLEHAASKKLVERLYEYIGSPSKCPHGNIIPMDILWEEELMEVPLDKLPIDKRAKIVSMPTSTTEFLTKIGISSIPKFLRYLEKLPDGTMIVRFDTLTTIPLPHAYQKEIIVSYVKSE